MDCKFKVNDVVEAAFRGATGKNGKGAVVLPYHEKFVVVAVGSPLGRFGDYEIEIEGEDGGWFKCSTTQVQEVK